MLCGEDDFRTTSSILGENNLEILIKIINIEIMGIKNSCTHVRYWTHMTGGGTSAAVAISMSLSLTLFPALIKQDRKCVVC